MYGLHSCQSESYHNEINFLITEKQPKKTYDSFVLKHVQGCFNMSIFKIISTKKPSCKANIHSRKYKDFFLDSKKPQNNLNIVIDTKHTTNKTQ